MVFGQRGKYFSGAAGFPSYAECCTRNKAIEPRGDRAPVQVERDKPWELKEAVKESTGRLRCVSYLGVEVPVVGAGAALDGCCDPITANLYDASQTGNVALEEAVLASLGCGRQSHGALAQLNPGETVLDLGSGGGGIDVLLSARRVGLSPAKPMAFTI